MATPAKLHHSLGHDPNVDADLPRDTGNRRRKRLAWNDGLVMSELRKLIETREIHSKYGVPSGTGTKREIADYILANVPDMSPRTADRKALRIMDEWAKAYNAKK